VSLPASGSELNGSSDQLLEGPHMPGDIGRDILPMTVKNMTFLVNRMGEDCSPLQFIRELTQNALDALQASGSGQVIWDVDWTYFQHTGVRKLTCIDTGMGMTGEQMVRFINELSSSIHEQSPSGNFGVGAKIAAAPRNPHGLVYKSWCNGVGTMVHLWLDPDRNVYGLKRWPTNGGEFWTPVADSAKPKEIRSHGTMVTLLGCSDEEDTMEPPTGTPSKSRWILRYLNTRYFRFPTGLTVRAREGWELPQGNKYNFLRAVEGQGVWLDKNAQASGTLPLSNAIAHWWIVRANADRDSGHFAPGGHMAALYQNELYELAFGRSGLSRLQSFGIIFGTDRVVIYLEPTARAGRAIAANTARTHLLQGSEALDWGAWAAEFREAMPEQLKALQEEIGASGDQKDHRKAILERLKQIKDLLRFHRFQPADNGPAFIDPEELTQGGEPEHEGGKAPGVAPTGKKGGRAGDLYAMFAESGRTEAEPVDTFSEPLTQWVSTKDNTRAPQDMEDRAAKFLREHNLLMINADFRVFTDMVDRWEAAYAGIAGSGPLVKEVVHEWFEQQLIEAVMSAQALKQTGQWSIAELEELWDESALTAAVLPRWHIDQTIKRTLGMRLGSLKPA
jgi:hypothetical protein